MTSIEFRGAHAERGFSSMVRWFARFAGRIVRSALEADRRRRDRAAFLNLLGKDDWVYRDLGVNRGDVEWAARLPLHVNAAHELEKLRARNMMGR